MTISGESDGHKFSIFFIIYFVSSSFYICSMLRAKTFHIKLVIFPHNEIVEMIEFYVIWRAEGKRTEKTTSTNFSKWKHFYGTKQVTIINLYFVWCFLAAPCACPFSARVCVCVCRRLSGRTTNNKRNWPKKENAINCLPYTCAAHSQQQKHCEEQ